MVTCRWSYVSRGRCLFFSFAISLAFLGCTVFAQQRFIRDQNIRPAFEGWEQNTDGSDNMVFGYLNRNWEEEPHVPIGPDNTFSPGPADRGQPTHFYPRRQMYVFKVQVSADWGDKELGRSPGAVGRTGRWAGLPRFTRSTRRCYGPSGVAPAGVHRRNPSSALSHQWSGRRVPTHERRR